MFLTVTLILLTFFIDDLESYYINDSSSAKRLDTAFPTIFLMSSNGGIFIFDFFDFLRTKKPFLTPCNLGLTSNTF